MKNDIIHCEDCMHCFPCASFETGFACEVWGYDDFACCIPSDGYCHKGEPKTKPINMDEVIWEGWTVGHFVLKLEPIMDMIMHDEAIQKPFRTKEEMAVFVTNHQPYYKKRIPGVIEYFAKKYDLK